MDNTYIIFFGKSQDFSFHAFDNKSYIDDFNTIIKDFDELESKIFTVDDVSNSQILSKYIFSKNGKTYSLLKLYSLAQAFSGNRIAGSIYGVALLSERDIKISEKNLSILNVAKQHFAQTSLDGLKFKTSDFLPAVKAIWKALINYDSGNLIEQIEFNTVSNFVVNNNIKAFHIKELLKDTTLLNQEINDSSRLYFTDDLAHLKRTQERWGKGVFPIYHLENGNYILYKEKPIIRQSPIQGKPLTPEEEKLHYEKEALSRENQDLKVNLAKWKKRFLNVSIVVIGFALLGITFFFKGHFGNAENGSNGCLQKDTTDLNLVLADSAKRDVLATLLENIKQCPNQSDKQRFYNAIVRDADSLGIDVNLFNHLKPAKTALDNSNEEYQKLVIDADALFKQEKWTEAKTKYQDVLKLDKENSEAKNKIIEIDKILKND